MSLSDVDRQLLQRCLDEAPSAWEDFVNRFLGLVIHVVHHTVSTRNVQVDATQRDDLVNEVFLVFLSNDRAVLRRFRRHSSLATYLAVVARRVVVRRLAAMQAGQRNGHHGAAGLDDGLMQESRIQRIEDRDQVEQLMLRLDVQEASVVRMFHLEGKSYQEISRQIGLAENSIGSVLSRARSKMRD